MYTNTPPILLSCASKYILQNLGNGEGFKGIQNKFTRQSKCVVELSYHAAKA